MGILDDAIREHLDLKRQHGAEESELEGLENEAFGPADRPEATDAPPADSAPSGDSEAQTQVISPGSSLTAPAGEGDQLDKVFEGNRQEDKASTQEPPEEPSFEEHELPPSGDSEPETQEPESSQADGQDAVAAAAQTEAEPATEDPGGPDETGESETDTAGGDAGDALEMERQHLAGQPTEHYDVDAALAEEDEIDLLSESSLSDELDRALDGPDDAEKQPEPPEAEQEIEPEIAAAPEIEEPAEAPAASPGTSADQDDASELAAHEEAAGEEAAGEEAAGEEASDEEASDEEATDDETTDADAADPADADFFDQEDPLEGTPDFLEETPEHDRLWFEQKEPKDFDFGD